MEIRVQKKINAVAKHNEDSVLTYKMVIPSIVNTLNKIYIPMDLYDVYATNFYIVCHLETFNLKFRYF